MTTKLANYLTCLYIVDRRPLMVLLRLLRTLVCQMPLKFWLKL